MVSCPRNPQFACTSTPTVYPPAFALELARSGARAALELVADHARAAADAAFLHRAALGAVERVESVLVLHVEAVHVVEVAVVGLGHDRQAPPIPGSVRRAVGDAPFDHGVAHDADAVGVGQHDRAFEKAALLDPGHAGHLAVAVEAEPTGENRMIQRAFLAARQDRGDARADRTDADFQLAFALDQRGEAHLDARRHR